MPTIELTRFRVEPDRASELLAARPAMLADFRLTVRASSTRT
ncbi:hypothetical protein [Streptomyces sp. HGB0020]|nr:hypothetical protein [Streptomyces sp. HGB0020]EPD54415.1 hypothetical protein HMPREF1211_08537 [Streptomyces sp. HGB0020]EPD63502.1 hypothetical protein HMPREF1211_02629 [Streptomyces sp. HGB0020]